MTVSALTIQGSTNTENALLLNFFGTAVPLTVLNGLTVSNNGQILDLQFRPGRGWLVHRHELANESRRRIHQHDERSGVSPRLYI